MDESKIISWIAQQQDVQIAITQEVIRTNKHDICSDFERSFSIDGIACKRVFTITAEKLEDLVCQIDVYL
jgi:hypothetical protein